MQLIRVFPLMTTADSIYVICRPLVQAQSYGSCLQITFPLIQTIFIRLDEDNLLSRMELINKCNQNRAVPKAKAIQSRVS